MSSVPFSANLSLSLLHPFRSILLPLLLPLSVAPRPVGGNGEHSVVSELTPFFFWPAQSVFSPPIPLGFMAGCSSSYSPPPSPRTARLHLS